MKCFFHDSDLDGHCSGAVVKYFHPECEMIGINYGDEFPWESIRPNEVVFMVDFALQPFERMERLEKMYHLVWVDHHKTAIEEAIKKNFECDGLQRIGIGGCALTWMHLNPKLHPIEMPRAVRFLAEYDIWDHHDPDTLPFQYGFRLNEDTFPNNQELWTDTFRGDNVQETINTGKFIIKYEKSQNAKFCKAYVFETSMPHAPTKENEITGVYRAICCNRGFTNSQLFDSIWDPEKYDLMITFCRIKLPAKIWTVSLYSTKPEIDCGAIAKNYGGGGHPGAAGFQCKELPFEY